MAVVLEKLTLMNPRPELGSAALFHAGGATYTVDDAIASAVFRGAIDGTIEETLALSAAEQRAEAEGFEPQDDALQAMSESFRYRHDLISAGETEEWLEARGMTIDDFSRWLYQRLCRDSHDIDASDDSVPHDLSDPLRVTLWMSGTMDELSRQLQRRIASGIEISGREALSTEAAMGQFLARHRLTERALSGWLTALRRDPSWLAETLRSEVAFDRLVSGATTDDARRRKLASMQLSLVKIDIETLELDSAAAAREAVLCVRDDGARLSEVARDAGYRSERAEVWMDALEDSVHQAILGAAEGEVIGPIECDAHFKVCQVLRKVAPSISDPAVSDRIDDVIIHEFFDDLCARHTHAPDVARTRK